MEYEDQKVNDEGHCFFKSKECGELITQMPSFIIINWPRTEVAELDVSAIVRAGPGVLSEHFRHEICTFKVLLK